MKYIISESQFDNVKFEKLNKFITSYLDNFFNSKQIQRRDSFIIIWKNSDDLVDDEHGVSMEYDYWDGRLWISKYFMDDFTTLFPLEKEQVYSIIKNSFENKFDVKVNSVEE